MDLQDKEMVPIPIQEFLSGPTIPVNLYVRLSDDKFVCVAKEDSKTQLDHLRSYEDREVEYLFIRRDDYNRYVGTNLMIAGVILNRNEIAVEGKIDFLTRASTAVMREIELLGFSYESYEHAKQVAVATSTLVAAKPDLNAVLLSLSRSPNNILAHSVATGAIAVMIGRTMGWTKPATLEKLSLGGLLHDVGLREIPPEIVAKPRAELTFDELLILESHPFRSMEILRSVASVPDDVVAIAYEHHENAIGQGYPRKIRDLRMNPLAKVVALADQFVELTIRSPNCPNPKSAKEALNFMENIMGQPYNREAFAALRFLVNNGQDEGAA
jgi:putative nucleotidyltransferase with HDIG domain